MTTKIVCEIPGRPVPCPRPRVSRKGTYYPKRYTDWLNGAKALLRDACVRQNKGKVLEGDVVVAVTFSGARPNSDIDNLCKAVLDAAQGSVFKDDRQVTILEAEKFKHDKEKYTHVEIWEVSDGDTT